MDIEQTISVYKPLIDTSVPSYNPRGSWLENLNRRTSQLTIQWNADGGWVSCQISLVLTQQEAEDWFNNGLNRHIEVYSIEGQRVWEGFVDQVSINMGTLSSVHGPLVDIANRVSVTYAPFIAFVDGEPIYGAETSTLIVDDATSQSMYGIIEKVYAAEPGRCTTAQAEEQRDLILSENRLPKSTETLNLGSATQVEVSLQVKGYYHRLKSYIYQNTATTYSTLSDKIIDVLTADPNGLFSTDYTQIEANAFLVNDYENENRFAEAVITDLVAIGGAVTDTRYLFGVYDRCRAEYRAQPTTALYEHRIADRFLRLTTAPNSIVVRPWEVQVGQWVFLVDYLPGQLLPTQFQDDPRYLFVEQATFSIPYGLTLNGSNLVTLDQLLAKRRASY